MKARVALILLTVCVLWCLPAVAAAPVTVQNLRLWRAPDNTRLVFDLSGTVEHHVFTLENPNRLVIDLDNARFQGTLPEIDAGNAMLSAFRLGRSDDGRLRFVLDLKVSAKPRSFVLKPAGQYGHRLVVDLFDPRADSDDTRPAEDAAPAAAPATAPTPPFAATPAAPAEPAAPAAPAAPTPRVATAAPRKSRDFIIAIDAGHGGEDPGARGRVYKTREKDVTLAIARELARQVSQEPGLKATLIRDGDYYVSLGRRYQDARRVHKADIFVSIHADALPGRRVAYGSSVYALSEKGATNALAHAIADHENYADLVGGVSLNDKPNDVRKMLLDLSTDKQIEHSLQLGDDVLKELTQIGKIHMPRVAQAGFAVLKSPDIPSILVETAFISTPEEEKKLRDPLFQRQLASAILKGVKHFLAREGRTAPAQQIAADSDGPREHVVKIGETLGSIAQQYNVHVEVLRFLNNLTSNEVPVGYRLRLPVEAGS